MLLSIKVISYFPRQYSQLIGVGGKLVLKKALFGPPNEWCGGEPARPLRPTEHRLLSPSLYEDIDGYHTWIDWAEGRMQQIWKAVIDADIERSSMLEKNKVLAAKLYREQYKELQNLRKGLVVNKKTKAGRR
jgi:hypothetical protein